MIRLDTNVLSELARAAPAPAVLAWADTVAVSELCTTAVTEAELRFGLALLPDGRRKMLLQQAVATADVEDVPASHIAGHRPQDGGFAGVGDAAKGRCPPGEVRLRPVRRRRVPFRCQNTSILSASVVAAASSSMVLREAPSMASSSVMPRASMQVPHSSTRPLPTTTRFSMRSRL